MSVLITDIETNGLDGDRIHCIVTQDARTGEVEQYYGSWGIRYGLSALSNAERIVGHNLIGFDLPFIISLVPTFTVNDVVDTLVLSRLLYNKRMRHSLESYAKDSEYDKVPIEDWSCLTYSMLDRCTLDVILNGEVYSKMLKKIKDEPGWEDAILMEHKIAYIHAEQVRKGVLVDKQMVEESILELDTMMEPLIMDIQEEAPLVMDVGNTYKKVYKKDGTYHKYIQNYIEEVDEDDEII